MITREDCRELVATLTKLGIQPGPNTDHENLCLTDDPCGSTVVDDSDLDTLHSYWVGWDSELATWVVAHQTYDVGAEPTKQDAERYVGDGWAAVPFQGW